METLLRINETCFPANEIHDVIVPLTGAAAQQAAECPQSSGSFDLPQLKENKRGGGGDGDFPTSLGSSEPAPDPIMSAPE